ncbi:single-stranded-DNA-specific exonuclease RecJ [Marinagarivorans algicola]|uniref:single-stranded-DNA-specific exonuclease RecJ n=1 Tax=Marinagarivorans algicola TaxID=1513270 RepID=UPI0006B9F4D2|nr:single-stranded-DNA-specific exonuclease RecJ [Marinagarivorans algicola]
MQKKIMARTVPSNSMLTDVAPVLARIYAARGVLDNAQLDYSLKHLFRPSQLKGIEQALTLLLAARAKQQRILIVGDFDADGATSTTVAVRCLRALGFNSVDYLVPNRFEYGYGLTPEIVTVAKQFEPDLLITVDNGISSIEGVAAAQAAGMKVLVTDHHLPGAQPPSADAIVNPNQQGCEFPTKNCAGVGVIFYVLSALRAAMQSEYYSQKPAPNFAQFLDLVSLGTVADVVPLDHNNRIFVQQGLLRMRAGLACEGIKAIAKVAGREITKLRASDLGFMVGPRLNAAGRLDDMSLGIRCLLTDDPAEALALASELDALNKERRAIEGSMQADAAVILEALNHNNEDEALSGVCLYQSDWHQGVIGILASRVKDKLHRPTIVFADDSESILKGSGRSVAGIHLRDVLDEVAAKNPGMLTKFGGHAMAAGLSLEKHHLLNFQKSFNEVVAQKAGQEGLTPVLFTDGALTSEDFNLPLAEALENAGPWGQAFPEPTFSGEFILVNQRIVGQKHLKLVLALPQNPQQTMDAISFNVDVSVWPNDTCHRVLVVYKLQVNEFNGRRNVQLLIDYIEAL